MACEFKISFFLFLFLLGSITIEIRTLKAVKKRIYFVSLAPFLSSRTQVRFFTIVLNKPWTKLVIQLIVNYQVPNPEVAISLELRLEYVNYAYHWNRQGIKSLKSDKLSLSVSILKP